MIRKDEKEEWNNKLNSMCKNCGHSLIAHKKNGKSCLYYLGKKKVCKCKKFIKEVSS